MTISTQRDVRVTIISRIWAYATAMLLISILISGWGHDRKVLLPVTIVFGATISTIAVLRKLGDCQHDALFPLEPLEMLKQRIKNLEAIAVSEASQLKIS
jgi:anaerobic C4-dicarboxylate transporter